MENNNEPVSYVAYESAMARMERQVEKERAYADKQNKRWFIICLFIFVLFVASNICWIVYTNSFNDVVTETYSAETQDGNAIANGSGEVKINGESDLYQN